MHHAAQRSIKVETVLLPNGISTVYGPTSASIHDVGGVLQMSGLGNFLMLIQQGRPDVYSAFGDSAYNAQYLQCIRPYYISLIPRVDITDDQKYAITESNPAVRQLSGVMAILRIFSKYACIQETTALGRGCRMLWSSFAFATYCRIFTRALTATRHPVTKNLTSCL